MANGFVEGKDPKVGRGSFAGLPEEKVMKEYPKYNPGMGKDMDDSMVGIDSANKQGAAKRSKYVSDQK